MKIREVPDFWGLHKNINWVLPLKSLKTKTFTDGFTEKTWSM